MTDKSTLDTMPRRTTGGTVLSIFDPSGDG